MKTLLLISFLLLNGTFCDGWKDGYNRGVVKGRADRLAKDSAR